jgi:hypothetical protein
MWTGVQTKDNGECFAFFGVLQVSRNKIGPDGVKQLAEVVAIERSWGRGRSEKCGRS